MSYDPRFPYPPAKPMPAGTPQGNPLAMSRRPSGVSEAVDHQVSVLRMSKGMWLFCSCGSVLAEYGDRPSLDEINSAAAAHLPPVMEYPDPTREARP